MTATLATQIRIDERSIPWIAGTQVKVMEIAMDKIASNWSPEEMHEQHPNLSLAQIHAALSYYYENQAVIDAQIQEDRREGERLAAEVSDPELRQRFIAVKYGKGPPHS